MRLVLLLTTALLAAMPVAAQVGTDQKMHCKALTEQAIATADQLRVPNLVSGVTQPSAGTAAQVYFGIQNSIANDRKASDTLRAAADACSLYNTTEDATLRLLYAIPSLQKDALEHRRAVSNVVESKLNDMIADVQNRMSAQDMTRIALYSLQTSKARVESDRATTQQAAALLYIPEGLSDQPIKTLIAEKQRDEIAAQKTAARLSRAGNWDVQLESGLHRQLFATTGGEQAPATTGGFYGGVTFTWGFASNRVDKHLDKAVDAYADWKEAQEGDVIRNAAALKQQLNDSIIALESQNEALLTQQAVIDANLAATKDSDTPTGLGFSYQLKADRLLLQIDLEDVQYRLATIRAYLQDNF